MSCKHADSVRVAYEIDGVPKSYPVFVCRSCGCDAPDPRCVKWENGDLLPVPWPIGAVFILLDYRKREHVHPALKDAL